MKQVEVDCYCICARLCSVYLGPAASVDKCCRMGRLWLAAFLVGVEMLILEESIVREMYDCGVGLHGIAPLRCH